MPLIQLWDSSPHIVLEYNIKQIVSAAGDGVLADNSECSRELKYYISNIPTDKLFEHVRYCLTNSFDKAGFALQDLINEFGRRLDYEVQSGLYQGHSKAIGFDGLWRAPDGHAIIVEVKTTDAFSINLDKLSNYRTKLIAESKIATRSSILIVVGRDDTGGLEAQIRGSRLAWDARIISIESLMKLLELKIQSEEDSTTEKIRSVLVPFEYTRLDNIIDVMFTAAQDVAAVDENAEVESTEQTSAQEHTPRNILDSVREKAINSLLRRESVALIAHKRSQYWSSDKKVRVVCIVSKRYSTGYYWYAFHPHQRDFLCDSERGFLLLGCVEGKYTYAIPKETLIDMLEYLNVTENDTRKYWHIHLQPVQNDKYVVPLPKRGAKLELTPFELLLPHDVIADKTLEYTSQFVPLLVGPPIDRI
jgi:hypothetical protein